MESYQLIIGISVIVLVGFINYKTFFKIAGYGDLPKEKIKFEPIKSLYKKLVKEKVPSDSLLFKYSSNPETRELTFQLLDEFGKTSLFPKEFYTFEKAAESNLINWLYYHDDFDSFPDEIEHFQSVVINSGKDKFNYHVFQFKVYEPHWAAKNDFMFGIVGPFMEGSKPYDLPYLTDSKFKNNENENPKTESERVHEHIFLNKKKPTHNNT
ncbi:hypothetical protein CLV91_3404 [Maribacter vaceletii]|uniref:Uncharacterized protein n=1 Tax=Maribacter vaceletii TaxID=1206816 RepID=A0A495DRT0_9FLAO|nr:hypothetical protein [Maribacter vaceletii]RKR06444.1 hypothetical protein CLV91_3404 [Maribacter vaceletii]